MPFASDDPLLPRLCRLKCEAKVRSGTSPLFEIIASTTQIYIKNFGFFKFLIRWICNRRFVG